MENDRYWFGAKRYGWGWGLPRTWQGWIVLLGFILLIGVGVAVLPPARETLGFALYVVVLLAIFVGICYLKGEPPRWRWGGK